MKTEKIKNGIDFCVKAMQAFGYTMKEVTRTLEEYNIQVTITKHGFDNGSLYNDFNNRRYVYIKNIKKHFHRHLKILLGKEEFERNITLIEGIEEDYYGTFICCIERGWSVETTCRKVAKVYEAANATRLNVDELLRIITTEYTEFLIKHNTTEDGTNR